MGADVRPRTLRVSSEGAMVVFSVTKDAAGYWTVSGWRSPKERGSFSPLCPLWPGRVREIRCRCHSG